MLLAVAVLLLAPTVSSIRPAHAQETPSAPSGSSGGGEAPSGPAGPSVVAPTFVPPQAPSPSQSQSSMPAFSLFEGGLSPNIASFEFHPTFVLSEQYTDNFFLTPIGHRENFRSTFGPGFTFLANTPKTRGLVNTTFNLAYDTVTSQEQFHFFPNILASLQYTYDPRLTFSLTETMVSGDDTLQADTFGLRGPERRQFFSNNLGLAANWLIDQFQTRVFFRQTIFMGSSNLLGGNGLDDRTITNTFGGNVSFPFLIDNQMGAGYELSFTDVSGPNSNLRNSFGDSTGHLVFLTYTRHLNPWATAGVTTSFNYQTRDNSRVWNGSLFGTYGVPGGLTVSARAGYSVFSADNRSDTSGFSTDTTISYVFGQVLTSLSVFQDIRQTYQQGENLGVVTTRTFSATVAMPVTEATRASFNASYHENEPTGVGNSQNAQTTKYFSGTGTLSSTYFSAGLRGTWGDNQLVGPVNAPVLQAGPTFTVGAFGSVPIGRWFSLSLDYTRFMRQGQTRLGDINENRATVSLHGTF